MTLEHNCIVVVPFLTYIVIQELVAEVESGSFTHTDARRVNHSVLFQRSDHAKKYYMELRATSAGRYFICRYFCGPVLIVSNCNEIMC